MDLLNGIYEQKTEGSKAKTGKDNLLSLLLLSLGYGSLCPLTLASTGQPLPLWYKYLFGGSDFCHLITLFLL
jgi:hypothetical protein